MAREFKATPAYRHAVPLLIGLGGPPGAGKTYSALVLATGIKAHRGGPIVVIDTERNRALRYAPPAGQKANDVDHFDFLHVPFSPPFGSLDFLEAVKQQRVHKPSCIIIDSASDEHEGDGGLLDFHDTELQRMAGDDWAKRERVGQAAWIKPKANRLEMMNGLFQIMTPIIFCFRAREKTKQIANDKGKQVPTNIGWTPIAPPEIIHNMDIFALLPIKSDGVPMWKGNTAYEDFSIKLPRQFTGLFPEGRNINQQMGQAMSIWALGDQKVDAASNFPGDHPLAPAAAAEHPSEPAKAAADASPPGPQETAGTPVGGSGMATDSDRPTETASVQPADAGQGSSESATTAATDSQDQQDSSPQAQGDLLNDGEPEPEESGFADFAEVCAGARDFPEIAAGFRALTKSSAWPSAGKDMQDRARALAFTRLHELVKGGYKFDFLDSALAYRCYISWETDVDAIRGNQAAMGRTKGFIDLQTKDKILLDNAVAERLVALEAASKELA